MKRGVVPIRTVWIPLTEILSNSLEINACEDVGSAAPLGCGSIANTAVTNARLVPLTSVSHSADNTQAAETCGGPGNPVFRSTDSTARPALLWLPALYDSVDRANCRSGVDDPAVHEIHLQGSNQPTV